MTFLENELTRFEERGALCEGFSFCQAKAKHYFKINQFLLAQRNDPELLHMA